MLIVATKIRIKTRVLTGIIVIIAITIIVVEALESTIAIDRTGIVIRIIIILSRSNITVTI